MTRRTNTTARRAPYREERSQVLIVCGGKVTEPAYFTGLKSHRRNPAISVTVKDKGTSPEGVVRHAVKLRESRGYDEVWCVVDVDQFDLDGAVRLARQETVNLAVSNPCFEYWLLLHFEACTTPLSSYSEVAAKLTKHLPRYSKAALKFRDFADGVDLAVGRARKSCPEPHTELRRNPATGVWRLVEAVL
jgi:hypothetical protein